MSAIYNETNYTWLFQQPTTLGNFTSEMSLKLINGTGQMNQGYITSYCRVEGMDLLLQMELAILVFVVIITLLLTVYVTLYAWRMLNYD